MVAFLHRILDPGMTDGPIYLNMAAPHFLNMAWDDRRPHFYTVSWTLASRLAAFLHGILDPGMTSGRTFPRYLRP